jgi:hypothetical protein
MATRQSPSDEIPKTVSHHRTSVLRTYPRVPVFQCAFHSEGIVYLPVGRLRALAPANPSARNDAGLQSNSESIQYLLIKLWLNMRRTVSCPPRTTIPNDSLQGHNHRKTLSGYTHLSFRGIYAVQKSIL